MKSKEECAEYWPPEDRNKWLLAAIDKIQQDAIESNIDIIKRLINALTPFLRGAFSRCAMEEGEECGSCTFCRAKSIVTNALRDAKIKEEFVHTKQGD